MPSPLPSPSRWHKRLWGVVWVPEGGICSTVLPQDYWILLWPCTFLWSWTFKPISVSVTIFLKFWHLNLHRQLSVFVFSVDYLSIYWSIYLPVCSIRQPSCFTLQCHQTSSMHRAATNEVCSVGCLVANLCMHAQLFCAPQEHTKWILMLMNHRTKISFLCSPAASVVLLQAYVNRCSSSIKHYGSI